MRKGDIRHYRKITGPAFEVHKFPVAGMEVACASFMNQLIRKPLKKIIWIPLFLNLFNIVALLT